MCSCVCVQEHVCHGMHVKAREQAWVSIFIFHLESGSLLLLHVSG